MPWQLKTFSSVCCMKATNASLNTQHTICLVCIPTRLPALLVWLSCGLERRSESHALTTTSKM
eukprot:1769796-Amphidinium_carterae.1